MRVIRYVCALSAAGEPAGGLPAVSSRDPALNTATPAASPTGPLLLTVNYLTRLCFLYISQVWLWSGRKDEIEKCLLTCSVVCLVCVMTVSCDKCTLLWCTIVYNLLRKRMVSSPTQSKHVSSGQSSLVYPEPPSAVISTTALEQSKHVSNKFKVWQTWIYRSMSLTPCVTDSTDYWR